MSNPSSPNANTLSFTSASDITPPVINLDSSRDDSSILILDNSTVESAENTLLAGGDGNRNPVHPIKTPMKVNSNDFIRHEAVTSTPTVPIPQNVVTPQSDGKRKRVESPELMLVDEDSGEGSDDEASSTSNADDTSTISVEPAPAKVDRAASNYDPSTGIMLPETVTLLTTPAGSRVYLVGTAHFSTESQDDVSMMIRAVNPNIVCIELCRARRSLLELDEKTILEEAKNINIAKVRAAIQQNGLVNGLVYILLLNMSAHLTKQLGVVPGGEFRRAVAEVRQLSDCMIHLSDRPLDVTIKRALHSLSWWQTAKLAWHLVTNNDPISKEEVERCKKRDLLEEMLKEMCGEYPEMGTVFLQERDIYLTYSLQLAAMAMSPDRIPRVVAVVGIGHVPGIVERWGRVTHEDIAPLMIIPEPTRSSKVIKFVVKASLAGVVIYAGYRLMPTNYIRAMLK